MNHDSPNPWRWLLLTDLCEASGLTDGQILARARKLRAERLPEFAHRTISRWGLDNPFAADHALRTLASFARRDLVCFEDQRRNGRTLAVNHIGLGLPDLPRASLMRKGTKRPSKSKPPQRWQDAPEIVIAKPEPTNKPQPQKERIAA